MSSGTKRARLSAEESFDSQGPSSYTPTSAPTNINSNTSSSFRNVSACNRCRLRKNRCDQNLPACTSCEKAGVKCVGFDPITKREIPRTYVYYLESRVHYLEELLTENKIAFAPSHDFDLGSKPITDPTGAQPPLLERSGSSNYVTKRERTNTGSDCGSEWEQKQDESAKLHKLVSNIGMVSVQGASDPRYLGSTSGISFARVVFAAVKSCVSGGSYGSRGSKPGSIGSAAATSGGTSMRDSFFGLQTKPNIKPAPFPDRELGLRLVNLYFEHANPQIPILHRPEFMVLFGRAYAAKDRQRSSRELYMLNIVFAIGAGTILEDAKTKHSPSATGPTSPAVKQEPASPNSKKPKLSSQQRQPEEYHASAMVHLESFLGSMPAADRPDGFGGGLEQLQAVLLLAGFALLRPVAPGLWYITGVAVRLAVDLGLHYEDGTGIDGDGSMGISYDINMGDSDASAGIDRKERGRREWIRDLRRRLWWCTYSFDRLVSTCVGRPFGITDAVITTDWPSVLDDKDITTDGFLIPADSFNGPSYKRVAHHYFRLRLLQSEILQVLQYRQAQRVHAKDGKRVNQYMHTKLTSGFLQPFDSFHAWREDIDRRLWEWKENAPLQHDTTVHFSVKFLELNYWQAVVMLYRQSLSVPPDLAGEAGPHNEVESPLSGNEDDHEHEDDIFLKVAEAGQRVLKLYRQLHRLHQVNYTYLATVHLFMAGIAFLYSIWHSPTVRSRLTLDDVDLTVLAATSVLGDLMDKCPPAEACRDAFDRMSKATIKMCLSTTGFGSQVKFSKQPEESPIVQQGFNRQFPPESAYTSLPSRPPPQFDYNLKDLFPENHLAVERSNSGSNFTQWQGLSQSNMTFGNGNQNPSYPYQTPSDGSSPSAASIPTGQQYESNLMSQPPAPTSIPTSMDATSGAIPNYDMYDFDFLMNNDNTNMFNAIFTGDSGLHLGFDANHDFTDGGPQQLPDIFGGFFFGPPAAEGMPEGGYPTEADFGEAGSNGNESMWRGGQD